MKTINFKTTTNSKKQLHVLENSEIVEEFAEFNGKQKINRQKIIISSGLRIDYIFYISPGVKNNSAFVREIDVKDGVLANFYYCFLGFGSLNFNIEYNIYSGTKVNNYFVYKAQKDFQIKINENFRFLGSNSIGNFISEGAALNNSCVDYSSNIFVNKNTKKNIASLDMKLHLLSAKSCGNLLPSLEVLSHSAKTAHAAKVYNFKPGELEYLSARGLGKLKANQLLKKGIFKVFAGNIKNNKIKNKILNYAN